ncbi:hypothetical protein FH972_024253 [Carpinus fangiana]|uniref:tRNA (guanine(37)-N1)-methyltransferase n=1 Tax=Carpinus fangiana TaxID=176857 RepID=A0A5N6KY10_9ROSI|nr:hypothetical protein FH972_024253 [Carpinus fangiana]
MFRPPVNRAMRILDRSFFQKDVHLAAARIFDVRNISRIRAELQKSKDILARRAVMPVQPDPVDVSKKCILLRPDISAADSSTWPPTIARLTSSGDVSLVPFKLHLDYDHWPAYDILQAVLPEEMHDDIPSGFNPVGHIAHFNLRSHHVPFKQLIGEVTIDKNAAITTVVNKTENLGSSNDADTDMFRVLPLEVIAGPASPDFHVEVREAACLFKFDFSKVFWNSRLGTEHERLVESFRPGEAVCDVMAGVGPFAIPAGKKGVFVWGNDLNPHCFTGLQDAIKLNKVGEFVTAFCEDGHTFIKDAAKQLWSEQAVAKVPQRGGSRRSAEKKPDVEVPRPRKRTAATANGALLLLWTKGGQRRIREEQGRGRQGHLRTTEREARHDGDTRGCRAKH